MRRRTVPLHCNASGVNVTSSKKKHQSRCGASMAGAWFVLAGAADVAGAASAWFIHTSSRTDES